MASKVKEETTKRYEGDQMSLESRNPSPSVRMEWSPFPNNPSYGAYENARMSIPYHHYQRHPPPPPPPHRYHNHPHYATYYPPPPTPFQTGPSSFAPHPYHVYMQHPPIEFISKILPTDVLSGRGGATNSHSGNRAFRALVKEYKGAYLKAKKKDKPSIAAIVVEMIRAKGGRFLKKHSFNSEGSVLWVDIGEKAIEKTSQALREGAPEIRRRKAKSEKGSFSDGMLSESSFDRTVSEGDEDQYSNQDSTGERTLISKMSFDDEQKTEEVLAIEPSEILLGRKARSDMSLAVEQLERSERKAYMNHFYPPNSTWKGKQKKQPLFGGIHASQHETREGPHREANGRKHQKFHGRSHTSRHETPEDTQSSIQEWPSVSIAI